MKTIFILSLLVLIAGGCSNKQNKVKVQPGGIYTFGNPQEEGAAHGKAYIYPENDSTLLFYIYKNNGAPSYNSGAIDGRVSLHDGKAIYRKLFDFGGNDCVLHFRFNGDTLTIAQENSDCECGFGHRVYMDNTFLRVSPEIPQYYTTISNDTVYFAWWQELEEQSDKNPYPQINNRFKNYFPDLILGQEHERGRLIPSEIADEYLPDMLEPEVEKNKFYAVGKITNYKGMDLFVCDYEGERTDEDTYDNHVDCIRWLLLYQKNGFPVLVAANRYAYEEDGITRAKYLMNSHYYGEGGERNYRSYFNMDTVLVSSEHISESESATGFMTPFVCDKEYCWTITSSGEREDREITKLEFSSPFYDRNYLMKQDWNELDDESFKRVCPGNYNGWMLSTEGYETNVLFHIKKIDGELFPVFETYDDDCVIDRYIVGKPHDNVATDDNNDSVPVKLKCPVIIKTSDGDLEFLPGQDCFRLRKGFSCTNADSERENRAQHRYQDQDSVILMLKQFYTSYISEHLKDDVDDQKVNSLKKKYVTEKFLYTLKEAGLDYDPFVNAQDYDENWLKSLRVEEDASSANLYRVFLLNGFTGETYCITLQIVKEKGEYKISNIPSLFQE